MKKIKTIIAISLVVTLVICSCSLSATPEAEKEVIPGLEAVPSYSGSLFIEINGGEPFFTEEDYDHSPGWEEYTPLDSLDREGSATLMTSYDHMEFSERPSISQYYPSGWVQNRYDTSIVEAGWLYNRSHTAGRQLGGADQRENLMTGTRLFNAGTGGMLTFENMVADHMKENRDHVVLYRATPDFHDDDLLAHGILIESDCLDCDDLADFCVYIYNVQPGVTIDYETGNNWISGTGDDTDDPSTLPDAQDYVINKSNGKFHLVTCRYAESMSETNREEITAPRGWMIENGYEPCGVCNP